MVDLAFSRGTLVMSGLDSAAVYREFPKVPWTWDPRSGQWRADAIHYASVESSLSRLPSEFTFVDQIPEWQSIDWPSVDLPALREEQQQAVSAWRESERACVVMATGTGKTEVAMSIMADQAVSTLVVAPVRDLMYQWQRRIQQRLGYDAGIIGDSRWDPRPVSCTTYDSAAIHMEKLGNRFELIVFDECHHLPGRSRREAALMAASPKRLGLTATPSRSDGNDDQLEHLIGPTCFYYGIRQATGKTLADYRVVRIPVHLNDDEREKYQGCSKTIRDYVVSRRSNDPAFRWEHVYRESLRDPEARKAVIAFRAKRSIEDRAEGKLRILEDLFRLHVGEPVIVFAGSNVMAREVSRQFLIPCLLNHCGKAERRDILDGLEAGDYPALVANQVLDEGVDLPEVNIAIVIGGTSSERQAKQRLGRILRRNQYGDATLYEVVTEETREVQRSRNRRRNDAFQRTGNR